MKWLSILWTLIKAVFGVATKPDPIAQAQKETEARVKAQERVKALEAALKGQEAARRAEANAHAAEVRYQDELHEAERPVPVPQTEAELQAIIDAVNEARKARKVP
jgi:hypothetical protein